MLPEGLFPDVFSRFVFLASNAAASDIGPLGADDFIMIRPRYFAALVDAHLAGEACAAWVERLRKPDETARLIEWRDFRPRPLRE